MLVSILDLETTGLNPDTDEVIEVGAVLYCTKHRAIVQQVSTLLPVATGEDGEVFPVSEIDPIWCDIVESQGIYPFGLDFIAQMVSISDYALAFNSDFEQGWFDHLAHSLPNVNRPWSDAAAIRYLKPSNSRSLIALCVAHGIPVVSAHRALDDCRLLAALLGTVPDLNDEIIRAARPRVLVQAKVGYSQKDEAKAAGFYWEGAQKMWLKKMPAEDITDLPFLAVEVEEF